MNDLMKIVKSHEECGNKLPKIKDGGYVINLDEYKSTGTQWIALYVNGNNIMHFDSSAVEHTFKEI